MKDIGMAAAGVAIASQSEILAQPMTSTEWAATKGDKVKVAFIGIGNQGAFDIEQFEGTNMIDVVALCDVDLDGDQCKTTLQKYPNIPRFRDFREMFDKCGNQFEAVIAAVPDFYHFPIAMMALKNGKHVYIEKPMSRTFNEAELMIQEANKHPELATQVGNQGHSEANYFQFKAWKEAGIIKDVTAVTAHMNSARRWHQYDSNMIKFPGPDPIPAGMDYMTWLGTRPFHEFSKLYHQGNWRCWYDFGMGALGDWGAHILDTVHEFLNLGLPYEVTMKYAKGHNDFFFPYSSTILFRFAARKGMPPCDVTWYDGLDNLPPLPKGFGKSELAANIPASNQGSAASETLNPGKIIYSKTLTFKGGSHGSTLAIIPKEKAEEMKSKLPVVPKSPSNHYENFLLACQGKEKTRSSFQVNGVLGEVFCLGVIAQRLNAQLFFDPKTKRFTNNQFANALLVGEPPRKGWEEFYKL